MLTLTDQLADLAADIEKEIKTGRIDEEALSKDMLRQGQSIDDEIDQLLSRLRDWRSTALEQTSSRTWEDYEESRRAYQGAVL